MGVSKEEFEAKIDQVVENLCFSHFYLKIHEKMTDEKNKFLPEYPTFFDLSRMAHYEAGILRLTKAYDKNSLGILKILCIFESNYRFWGISEYLDTKQLEHDKNSVKEETNTLVKKLIHLRDKVISHTDNKLYPPEKITIEEIDGVELLLHQDKFTTEEIEKLSSPQEKNAALFIINSKFDEALKKYVKTILGQEKPEFHELYDLTTKGVEICNRYMLKIGKDPIELKLEGID